MKKLKGIFLLAAALFCLLYTPKEAGAYTGNYELGTQVTGSLGESVQDVYYFTLLYDTDIMVALQGIDNAAFNINLESADGRRIEYQFRVSSWGKTYYLAAGSYTCCVEGKNFRRIGDYALNISKQVPAIQLAQTQGEMHESAKKEVPFYYNCSKDYALQNISVASNNSEVATVELSVNDGNTGILTINPKTTGQTSIILSVREGNTVEYTVLVTGKTYYISKKQTLKLANPIGFSSVKWKSSKKSVVSVSKSGELKAKANGRANITAKNGNTTFTYRIIVTDYVMLGKKAYKRIKENVRNPEKLKIYNIYYGYDKNRIEGYNIPVIFIDYGATNAYGAMVRNKIIAYYNDVHELSIVEVKSYSDITKRKSMKASKIKKK